jgi:hypothetical protein
LYGLSVTMIETHLRRIWTIGILCFMRNLRLSRV